MTGRHEPIDWESCDTALVERHEAVLADLLAKQLVIDGEPASDATRRGLDQQAAAIVQAEVDQERVESQITDAMYDDERCAA